MIDLIVATALAQAVPTNASASAQTAPAPQWRLFNHDGRGDGFVDLASIRRDGDGFDATTRVQFSTTQSSGVRTVVTRFRFDCAARTFTSLHMLALDGSGAVVSDRDVPEAERKAMAPLAGAPALSVLDEYCPRPAAAEGGNR